MTAWQPGKSPLNLYRDDLREALGRSGKTLTAMRHACNTYGAGVLDAPDARTWVWSDLHLGHNNIITFQDRPFDSLGQMNEALWYAWADTVGLDDTLVCVGDFAMASAVSEATWARVRGAPGRSKILVVGNHDLSGQGRLRAEGFHRTKALLTSPGDPPLVFTHAPLPNVPAGHVNIHGHQHSTPPTVGTPHINVSVEQLEYRPIRLDRLRRLARCLAAGDLLGGDTTLERLTEIE